MADNTIDSLQLKISADAQSAEKSIGRLADSLLRLQSSLKGITGGQFQNLSSGITELSNSMQQFSGSVKTADFTRIATGLNKLSSVNVQGVSDASRAINTLTANLSQIGSIAFDSQGIANVANAIAQLGRKTVTQATANIPALTTALSSLINGLNQIGTVKFDVTGLSELTSSISKLGGKSATTAASGNITKLATALKQMMTTLSTAPRVSQNIIQMTQTLAQLASTGSRAGTATNTLIKSFNTLPSSTAKAKSGFSGLASAFGKFYATYWLFIRGMSQFKKAIDISSDLTEVQNVVDVSFGDMSDKMNEFADSALELYGMSELTAKQIGSRFQAMGVAMGFAQKDMTDMSIRLTQLAGDLASFYNISQDSAAQKLQSIFTGETEPMRQLGLDLSFATVEAWALSQGINADMQSMTQAEKTMLRYQYVLANTGQATDDFIRTQNSWANQLRLLTGAFEQLGSIVGGVLINAFKPFIQALNSVMGAVISFAETVSNALGAIFGWEYQTGGGVAQDLELGAGAAEDIEDATGGAAKNAKELNKYIAAWHEVNNMTTNDGTSGSGGGGGGGAGGTGGAGSGGQWVQSESLWEKYTSDIDSLYELGEYIGKVLTDAMNSIDWDSVYQGARNFGTGLANFLNGLISPDLFGAVGRTIAGALNTAIYAALAFGQTFDWADLGLSIATGINEFFKTFDFKSLARTINTWAHGILDTVIEAIDNIKWSNIGKEIGEFFLEIDFTGIMGKVGKAIWKALNAAIDTWLSMFSTAPIETALLSWVAITKLLKTDSIKKFITVLSNGAVVVNAFGNALSGNTLALNTLIKKIPGLTGLINTLSTSLYGLSKGHFLTGLSSSLRDIGSNLSFAQKGAVSFVAVFGEFHFMSDAISDLITGTGNAALSIAQIGASATIAGMALYTALGPAGIAIAAITGITAAIAGTSEAIEEMVQESAMVEFSNQVSEVAKEVSANTEEINKDLESLRENYQNAGESQAYAARSLASEYESLREKTSLTADEQERLNSISSQLVELVPELSDYIDDQTGSLNIQSDALESLIDNMELYAKQQAAQETLVELYKEQYEAQKNVTDAQTAYNKAIDEFLSNNEGMSESVKNMVKAGDIEGLRELYRSYAYTETPDLAGLKDEFGDLAVNGTAAKKMVDSLEESIGGYKDALDDAKKSQVNINSEISSARNMYSEATSEIIKNENELNKIDETSTEFLQTVSDLKNEFKNMDLSFSDEFINNIAKNQDSTAVESIIQMFGNLKEQVQLSSEELQMMFSQIVPGLSESFSVALAEQSPEMQLQVATTLGNLASGAQVSAEELKTVFNSIGIDLPNEIILGFQDQELSVQTSAINLLSKIQDGESLVEGNLLQLFDSLGIYVPTELIDSMGSMEASTQQKTIELLSQISAGYDFTAEDLITRFNDLGIQLPDNLQESLESENEETRDTAVDLLRQLLNAEEDQRPEIIRKMNNLGKDASKTYDTGLGSNNSKIRKTSENIIKQTEDPIENEFSDTSSGSMYNSGNDAGTGFLNGLKDAWENLRGWIGNAVDNLVSWVNNALEIGSPSKVFKRIGQFTIEGFNLGMEDKMDGSYSSMSNWIKMLQNGASNFEFQIPKIDVSIDRSKYQFTPTPINTGKLQTEIQESLSYMFGADGFIDYNRLGDAVYQAQSQALQENPVQIGDNEIFQSARRAQQKFRRRTGKIGWAGI